MTEPPLAVLAVVGSLNRASATRAVVRLIAERLTLGFACVGADFDEMQLKPLI